MLFSGRMMWQTGCKKLPLSLINSRTNTLIVKQRVLLPGNGVVLQYNSRNTTKKYYQGTSLKASLLLYVRGLMARPAEFHRSWLSMGIYGNLAPSPRANKPLFKECQNGYYLWTAPLF